MFSSQNTLLLTAGSTGQSGPGSLNNLFTLSNDLFHAAASMATLNIPTNIYGASTSVGTSGDDLLSAPGATDDALYGLGGNDTLLGHGGVDQLSGSAGNDLLDGGDLADALQGDAGDDTLRGGDGYDALFADNPTGLDGDAAGSRNLLFGGSGGDVLTGALGQDTLEGGDGQDVLNGGGGADFLRGGTDADLFLVDLSVNPFLASNFLAADTIADFSRAEGDSLSFGLGHGVLQGAFGPAPLIWRGSLQTNGGPALGLALPGGDLGLGYLQAWFIPTSNTDSLPGGWIAVDIDQDNTLGTVDLLIRLVLTILPSDNFYTWMNIGSFAGMAGSAADEAITAPPSGARLFGLDGADFLLGAQAVDWLSGGAHADTLSGLGGADQLWGGAGDDWIHGGNGDDALYADGPTLAEMDGADAANYLDGDTGNDSLFGGAGLDFLLGSDGVDFLYGADGADTLEGGIGDDRLLAGEGSDSLVGGSGSDTLEGGGGDDRLLSDGIADWLDGGDGFDWLMLSFGLFINLGLSGNQVINGAWIAGFEAVDARTSLAGMTIQGGAEANQALGGSASDSLIGDGGDDYLQGNDGNDTLIGGPGQNILEGGAGHDFYQVESSDDLAIEHPEQGSDTISTTIDFYLPAAFETLILALGSSAQRGAGNEGNNLLIGNALGNEILGGFGNDTIQGGAGDDTLQGGLGSDELIGGDGLGDWASYSDFAEFGMNIWVNLISGIATGAAGSDQLQGMEHALTGAGHDQLIGNAAANFLSAGAGADMLRGEGGADTLEGGEHDDTLHGGGDDDVLSGGVGQDSISGDAGNDTLIGNEGADTMAGGSGNDLFYFIEAQDSIIEFPGGGQDTIMTATNLVLSNEFEVMIVVEGVSDLHLIAGAGGAIMIGNGLSHHFQGGAGDDVILAGGGTLTDILALFVTWS